VSFQAPDSDLDPGAGGFKAPEDDADPPKTLEGFLGNVGSNAMRAINPLNIAKGLGASVKEGLYDIPKAAAESSMDLVKGAAKAATGGGLPSMEDVAKTPILEKTRQMTEPIAKDPLGYAYKNPVDAAMLMAAPITPFLGAEGAEEAAGNVARGTIPEATEAAEVAGGTEKVAPASPAAETPLNKPPEGPIEVPAPAKSLKDLPVVQPGAKTGDPHALFAYNDNYGPGKTERSLYNIFGDPGHPRLTQAGGYGSSVTKEILDQAGIPVVGREPRSVGKWEPIETAPSAPAGEAGTAKAAPEAAAPPPKSIFETGAEKALDQGKELKDYITRGYEGYAKKPGTMSDVADWIQEKSQMMAAQQMGFTPNQVRQLGKTPLEGHNAMRAIGQYALDKELVSPTTGLGGMLEKNHALTKSVGKTIGDYREMADKLAGEIDPKDVVKEVRKALDKKYMRTVTNAEGEESGPRGAYGGQAGAYLKALQEVEDAEKSHSGISEAATELNHAANKAAKNMQPETPFTDVANEVSRINNARIKQLIGEENAAKYEQALREFGVNKKIANALKFKSSGEVKRFGPGSTFSNLTQKAMDELGYRVGAKSANKLSTAIKNNPAAGRSLPSLFKEFIHQVEDVGHDVTGMAKGGIVPDDVKRYVASKC
jgi:hypothetical protein